MIPFILGIICGFALANLIFVIFVVVKASSLASRSEEGWDQKDDIHGYAEPTGSDETD